MKWVIPIFRAQTPGDERLSAQCAALAMIRYGTTYLPRGRHRHPSRRGDGRRSPRPASAAGSASGSKAARAARRRSGRRSPPRPSRSWNPRSSAIRDDGETRLAAWPVLVGHSTNSDDVWRAAKALADEHGLARLGAHEPARSATPNGSSPTYGRRPLEHLADIGVLGANVALTHLAAHRPSRARAARPASGASAIHCAARRLPGRLRPLADRPLIRRCSTRGVNVMLGTDGVADRHPVARRG